MKRCASCKDSTPLRVHEPAKVEFIVDGRAFTGSVPRVAECVRCGAEYASTRALKTLQMMVARDLAVSAAIGAEGFRYMRKALDMKAKHLASLLDVTRETLSRWEMGEREIPRMAWTLLAGIVLEVSKGSSPTLSLLIGLKDPVRVPKTNVVGDLSRRFG